MWRHGGGGAWDARNPFDADCASDRFLEFVDRVLERYPAWCSRMFEDYVGGPGHEIEFVGRFERLADDLVCALRRAGERFDEHALRQTPPVNVSPYPASHLDEVRQVAPRVLASENDAIVRFGY